MSERPLTILFMPESVFGRIWEIIFSLPPGAGVCRRVTRGARLAWLVLARNGARSSSSSGTGECIPSYQMSSSGIARYRRMRLR
jgi:hypothetical protein